MIKKKLFLVTTVPMSFIFFKGQILLLKNYFDVTLISSPENELKSTADLNGVKYYGILMKREISLFNDILSLVRLVIYFLKTTPDVVHCNTPKGSLLSLAASYICNVPTRIYYVHGLRYQGFTGFKRKLLIFMEKLSCRFATDIIAVSEGVKFVMLEQKITEKKIEIIWNGSVNGIDLNYFNPRDPLITDIRPEYNIKEDEFLFGFVGRLVGDKGINELVEAFSALSKTNKKIKLLLVGKYENDLDPLKDETLEIIKMHPNIVYAGVQSDVRSYFHAMDLFVFPSYREGFGIVLMEAAAMNVPSISSDIIGCNEIIEDNVNGFLIPPKNKEILLKKMSYAINNKLEIVKMSEVTRNVIQSKFEQQEYWTKTIEMYKKICY